MRSIIAIALFLCPCVFAGQKTENVVYEYFQKHKDENTRFYFDARYIVLGQKHYGVKDEDILIVLSRLRASKKGLYFMSRDVIRVKQYQEKMARPDSSKSSQMYRHQD